MVSTVNCFSFMIKWVVSSIRISVSCCPCRLLFFIVVFVLCRSVLTISQLQIRFIEVYLLAHISVSLPLCTAVRVTTTRACHMAQVYPAGLSYPLKNSTYTY